MSQKHLHILCPGLISVPIEWLEQIDCPYLQRLIRVSNRMPNRHTHLWDKLADLVNWDGPLPAAAFLVYDSGCERMGDWYVLANPVEYQADLKTLYCVGSGHLAIQKDELDTLVSLFQALLPAEITLTALEPHCWLISAPQAYDLSTTPLTNSIHHLSPPVLFGGQDAVLWQRWLTELQMSWHVASVNIHRVKEHLPPVNGVWLSGAGCLPNMKAVHPPLAIWTDDPITRGLGKWIRSSVHDFEPDCLSKIPHHPFTHHSIVLESLWRVVYDNDAWSSMLTDLDQTLFKPIWECVRKRQIQDVNLWFGGEFDYHLVPKHTWRFWRRQQSWPS